MLDVKTLMVLINELRIAESMLMTAVGSIKNAVNIMESELKRQIDEDSEVKDSIDSKAV